MPQARRPGFGLPIWMFCNLFGMLLMKYKIRTRSSWASMPTTPDGDLGPIQHLLYFVVALQFGVEGKVGLKEGSSRGTLG